STLSTVQNSHSRQLNTHSRQLNALDNVNALARDSSTSTLSLATVQRARKQQSFNNQGTAEITTRICSPTSTGVVLLCNIVPGLCVKILCPFIMHRIPYWVRHTTVCVVQVSSLLLTAFSESVLVALCGVCLASFSSGLGETTYLGLAGHYSKHTIATWSSGTGMAGIVGAFSYAGLTDSRLLALLPAQAMLVMLVVPAIFMFTFYVVLEHKETMKKIGSTISIKSAQPP
ncbi:CLN3 protein, partial [Dictyocaulus viviparus]